MKSIISEACTLDFLLYKYIEVFLVYSKDKDKILRYYADTIAGIHTNLTSLHYVMEEEMLLKYLVYLSIELIHNNFNVIFYNKLLLNTIDLKTLGEDDGRIDAYKDFMVEEYLKAYSTDRRKDKILDIIDRTITVKYNPLLHKEMYNNYISKIQSVFDALYLPYLYDEVRDDAVKKKPLG